MLKANQLAVARLALDFMQERAKNKSVAQLARLNGLDETTIVTSVGTIVMPWVGKVSSKVPTECRSEPLPVEWDDVEESYGILTGNGKKYSSYPDEQSMLVAEMLRVDIDSGIMGLDVLVCRGSFKYLVTSDHSIYLVRTKADGTNDASWLSSRVKNDNIIMAFSEEHEKFLATLLTMDESATVSMTLHPRKAGILHILSDKLHVAVNLCMPGAERSGYLNINKNVKTSLVELGTFEKLIEKGKEMEETKTIVAPPVSPDQLMQLAGMAVEGIRKPMEEQDTAPWPTGNPTPEPAPAAESVAAVQQEATEEVKVEEEKPTEDTQTTLEGVSTSVVTEEQNVTEVPEVKQEESPKEPEMTTLESLDILQSKFSEHIQQLKDVYIPLLREDQRDLRSLTAKYRAECKGSKKSSADSDVLEALKKEIRELKKELEDRDKKIKKLQNMVEAAMK